MPTMERLLLRPAEAAELLGCSRAKAYELIEAGQIPSMKLGRVTRVPTEALREWVARQVRQTVDAA